MFDIDTASRDLFIPTIDAASVSFDTEKFTGYDVVTMMEKTANMALKLTETQMLTPGMQKPFMFFYSNRETILDLFMRVSCIIS
jgi:hypothetical protein